MKSNDTRETLTNEFFAYKGYREPEKVNRLIKRLKAYVTNNKTDREIAHMLITLQADKESYVSNDFEKCREITTPIFEELLKEETRPLSFLEVAVLARVIEFAPTFEIAKHTAQKVFTLLETEYSREEKYRTVKWMVSFNILPRLIREKYPNANSQNKGDNQNEIESLFKHHLEISKTVCEKNNMPPHLAMLQVREGAFFADSGLIEEGISWLRKHEWKGLYPSSVDELLTYYTHLGGGITKTQLDILIGHRINKKREALNITPEDAAEALGLSASGLSQIETGRRGAKAIHLYKLAYLFNVDVSYFFYGEADVALCNDDERLEALLQEIRLNLQVATDEVRGQVASIVKTLTK